MIDTEKIKALIVLVEDAADGISNVHTPNHLLKEALRNMEESLLPCKCEYCLAEKKKLDEFTL